MEFMKLPVYVGAVEILPGVQYNLTKKPARFHLFMMRLLLGWKWIDAKNPRRVP